MSDVKDILGVGFSSARGSSASSSLPPIPTKSSSLSQLAKDETSWQKPVATSDAPLNATRNIKKLIQDAIQQKKPVSKWRLEAIRSSARSGEPEPAFQHWVKVFNVPDYRFARFNKSIKMYDFSEDEYYQFPEDNEWTYTETRRLMELCKQFDLRFLIIHDRYNSSYNTDTRLYDSENINRSEKEEKAMDESTNEAAASPSSVSVSASAAAAASSSSSAASSSSLAPPPNHRYKTVEQLKARFYTLQQSILLLRNSSDPDLRKHPVFAQAYEEKQEIERKQEAEKLWHRKADSVEEMAEMVLEHRKLVQLLKKLKSMNASSSKKDMGKSGMMGHSSMGIKSGMKTPGSSSMAASSAAAGGLAASGIKGMDKKKVAKAGPGVASAPVLPTEMAPIPDHCLPVDVFPSIASSPVTLRSQQIAAPLNLPPRSQKQLETELITLNIKKPKELIPTTPVTVLFDRLRSDILTYHQLQKYVQEREQLRDQLKVQIQPAAATSSLSSLSSSSAAGAAGAGGLGLPSGGYYSSAASPMGAGYDGKSKSKSAKVQTPGGSSSVKEERYDYSYAASGSKGLAGSGVSSGGKKTEKRKSLAPGESGYTAVSTPGGEGNDAKRRKK